MSNLIKKENLTIVIGEYTDAQGNEKKQYRTIGELITMMGNDGQPYQFGKLWGPTGYTEIKVYPQDDNKQQTPQPSQQQAPPQQYNQAPQQQAPQQYQQAPQHSAHR